MEENKASKSDSKPTKGKPEDVLPTDLENQKELLDLEAKRLDNFDKKLKIRGLPSKDGIELSKVVIDEINVLRWLLSDTMLDVEATVMASEPKMKHMFGATDQEIIRKKIMRFVKDM